MEMRNPYKPSIKKVHYKHSFHECEGCDISYKDIDMWEYKYAVHCKIGSVECSKFLCDDCAKHSESIAIKKLMDSDDYKRYITVENKIKVKSKHKGK